MNEDTRTSHGMRIKYHKEGDIMVSARAYHNGKNMVKVVIDIGAMRYRIVDPATGITLKSGGEGINNLEVLMRKAKKGLKDFLGIYFEKESRELKTDNAVVTLESDKVTGAT